MKRITSQIILSGLLALGFAGSPLRAQTPQAKPAVSGADLFKSGWNYDQGLGTPINLPEAFRLYNQAAALGNPLAKARLAQAYFNGNGVEKDQRTAERLGKEAFPGVAKAAQQNDAIA